MDQVEVTVKANHFGKTRMHTVGEKYITDTVTAANLKRNNLIDFAGEPAKVDPLHVGNLTTKEKVLPKKSK